VRERCLNALKDRLVERANIIQVRLEDEQAGLARRQAAFTRDRDMLSAAEEEEYERAVEEAAFRISILQVRGHVSVGVFGVGFEAKGGYSFACASSAAHTPPTRPRPRPPKQ